MRFKLRWPFIAYSILLTVGCKPRNLSELSATANQREDQLDYWITNNKAACVGQLAEGQHPFGQIHDYQLEVPQGMAVANAAISGYFMAALFGNASTQQSELRLYDLRNVGTGSAGSLKPIASFDPGKCGMSRITRLAVAPTGLYVGVMNDEFVQTLPQLNGAFTCDQQRRDVVRNVGRGAIAFSIDGNHVAYSDHSRNNDATIKVAPSEFPRSAIPLFMSGDAAAPKINSVASMANVMDINDIAWIDNDYLAASITRAASRDTFQDHAGGKIYILSRSDNPARDASKIRGNAGFDNAMYADRTQVVDSPAILKRLSVGGAFGMLGLSQESNREIRMRAFRASVRVTESKISGPPFPAAMVVKLFNNNLTTRARACIFLILT